jgi:hypothetical protein
VEAREGASPPLLVDIIVIVCLPLSLSSVVMNESLVDL